LFGRQLILIAIITITHMPACQTGTSGLFECEYGLAHSIFFRYANRWVSLPQPPNLRIASASISCLILSVYMIRFSQSDICLFVCQGTVQPTVNIFQMLQNFTLSWYAEISYHVDRCLLVFFCCALILS